MALVQFTRDCAPYCLGDIVELPKAKKDENGKVIFDPFTKEAVDKRAKKYDLGDVYKELSAAQVAAIDKEAADREKAHLEAVAAREAKQAKAQA